MLNDPLNNLNRPRPDEWGKGSLFPFIEQCWSNSVGVVGNNNIIAARLSAIDTIFEATHQNLKPTSWTQLVPSLLMLRSFSAFRAGVMVALSLPADSFPLQRLCLESAGYARLIEATPDLSALWLKRDENQQEIKKCFTNRSVRDAIAADDKSLADIYQDLYERSIDFGAHPNEKGVLTNVLKESIGTETLKFWMLAGDGPPLQHALRMCAQVGICALKVFNLIFANQFMLADFDAKISSAERPF